MFYKTEKDVQGEYVGPDGDCYCVLVARRVRNAQGVNVGYVEFPSLEAALEYWGLRDIPEHRNASS